VIKKAVKNVIFGNYSIISIYLDDSLRHTNMPSCPQ